MSRIAFENLSASGALEQLLDCSQSQFTGRLTLRDRRDRQWQFYLGLGRIVWATGGVHPHRRLRRLLARYCPQTQATAPLSQKRVECGDYQLLAMIARRDRIPLSQIRAIVARVVVEVLFDLLQQGHWTQPASSAPSPASDEDMPTLLLFSQTPAESSNQFCLHLEKGVRPSKQAILPANCFINLPEALNQAQKLWTNWQQAGLQDISPDAVPQLVKPQLLRRQMSKASYKNLVTLIDGQRTLRDLAVLLKSQPLKVTLSLFPYIRQGTIESIIIPDIPFYGATSTAQLKGQKKKIAPSLSPSQPKQLIACIDDSPQICSALHRIFTKAGYRFISVQDSTFALPALLESKPDLIFLDLVMPIANGYELCTQIRRISCFQSTPIVILTGREGIIDRVRAKMVGASDYLRKPFNAQHLLEIVERYLVAKSSFRD
ncbi:MAG: response regulator [Cyanobacteriota bacterium]|nr:response regulator [Cyanobacteriota bacterium]